ncbi:MAG: helix-turn-helix transcriptional regulator [Deltaproteobacteria bacterium]|nr:helix-turn-helix transcriptional regulator [Deltaproteobacteria bacterium]
MKSEQTKIIRRVGAEIRRIRLSKGKTLEDMQEYGFSPAHFQKIESGRKSVNFYTLYRLAKAFKVKLADLMKAID